MAAATILQKRKIAISHISSALWPIATKFGTDVYTVSQKRPTFGLLQLWRTWMDFDIFGRNVTDKVGNQKMPPQITCASALPVKTGKHGNHIFHSIGLCYTHNARVRCLPKIKNVICDVFDSV